MPSDDAQDELDRLVADACLTLATPALAAGAIYADGTTWTRFAGRPDLLGDVPTTPATRFRIGSVTKTFTAAAALLLVEEGALALDAPAVSLLPELAALRTNGHPLDGVTLRRLLSHRAGLVSDPPTRDWYAHRFPPIEELLAALGETELAIEPGTRIKYSNLGYALVGELIARAAGMPYAAFLEQRLLQPLGLAATGLRAPDGALATGYLGRPDDRRPLPPAAQPYLGGEESAGQMSSTAPDLLRWLALQLGHVRDPALPPALLARMQAPQGVAADLSRAWTLGWTLERVAGRVVHHHGGGVDGFTCFVAFDREARVGAVVLTNGEVLPGPVAFALLAAARRFGPPAAPRPRAGRTPPDRSLVGSYDGVLSYRLHVGERDGALHVSGGLVDDPDGAPLEPLGGDAYRVTRGRFAGELLVARRDRDGAVSDLTLGTWRYARAAPPPAGPPPQG